MTPEMARIIDRLRDWHTRSTVAYADEYTTLLGQAEAIVSDLLALVDTEGPPAASPMIGCRRCGTTYDPIIGHHCQAIGLVDTEGADHGRSE